MSDANMPPKGRDSSESMYPDYPSDRFNDPAAQEDTAVNSDLSDGMAPDWEDWQTVNFPNALNVDELERQSLDETDDTAAAEEQIEPDWQIRSDNGADEAGLEELAEGGVITRDPQAPIAQISELLSLVRDLNQCNDALLSRVRHLEEELEASQSALQTEGARSHEQTQRLNHSEQLLQQKHEAFLAAQEQVTKLTNDLEFARQTAQRHEIRIGALNDQLETSQQRIAQLERECTLLQQRYQEQTQLLHEANNTCRDLRSRLQRQQRYTLQFKAALEKCLDVPPPRYQTAVASEIDDAEITARYENPLGVDAPMLLPKVQQIRPWSDQAPVTGKRFDWSPPTEESASATDSASAMDIEAASPSTSDPAAPLQSDFDPFVSEDPPVQEPRSGEPDTLLSRASISYDLKQLFGEEAEATPAEGMDQDENAAQLVEEELSEAAEDALWQDLARLIDASVDTVPGAPDEIPFESASPDVTEESVEPAAIAEPPAAQTAAQEDRFSRLDSVQEAPEPEAAQPAAAAPSNEHAAPGSQRWAGAFTIQSSWPSPVVYPLRPQKRRKSMAAVELPSFPRYKV